MSVLATTEVPHGTASVARFGPRSRPLDWVLFTLALVVYGVTRFWGLDQFPVYFFTDEAFHPLHAEELLERGLRDARGTFLPIYFEAAGQRWTPVLSVYAHLVTVALFGKSVIVTRATSAAISLLGAAAVGLTLRLVFRLRLWWAGVLFMAITPAWFLHSRTAFETVMMASLLAWLLLFYLLYRTRSPLYLFAAIPVAAAAFYTYSNGQGIIVALAALLAVSDARYHLRHRRTVLTALLPALILAVPLVSFQLNHPSAMQDHLRTVDSYWFRALPVGEKLQRFAQYYLYGLSPQYWFFPNGTDLIRHVWKGHGHIRTETLPLVLIGVGVCLWRFRSSPHRTVLLAAMATPVAAALVGVGITRVLAFVVPASILAGLGVETLVARLPRPGHRRLAAVCLFVLMSGASLAMLRDAILDGPLWYRDYGLYGMQYGARQLFDEAIPEQLRRDPGSQVMVSPTWANGTDNFLRFFLSDDQRARVQMRNVDYYLLEMRELPPNLLLVMTPDEYTRARDSGKFKTVRVDQIVPYPDGNPGFYLARLAYADNAAEIMAAEREARRRLVVGQMAIDGQTVQVGHSLLDAGQLRDMFDRDRHTLARGMEANPFILELTFPWPRKVNGIALDLGSMDFSLAVKLYAEGAGEVGSYTESYRGLPPDPHVEMAFSEPPERVVKIRVEIKNLLAGERANIHVRDVSFR